MNGDGRWWRCVAGPLAVAASLAACDAQKPSTRSPGDADADDLASASGTATPEAAGKAEPDKVRPSVQDRDPEEEKKKMAKSRQQSAAARTLLAKGSLAEAIEASRQALRIHEQNVDAMLVIAQAYYKQSKWEITLAVTSSALAVDPKIRTPAETSEIHNLQAFAYDKMGKPSLATESFKEAAQADDKNAAAWNNLGTRYLAAGDNETALGCFQYALELDPNFPKAQVNYGAALRATGKVQEAEKAFVRALQLQPNYGAAYFNLGVLYLDADPYPGLDTAQRLNKSIEFLSKYQQNSGPDAKPTMGAGKTGAPPVSRERADDYIRVARKGLEREQRRMERESKRGGEPADDPEATSAGDAGGSAEPAVQGAGTPTADGGAPTPVKPGGSPTPVKPGGSPTPVKPGGSEPVSPEPTPSQPSPTPSQPTEQPKPAPTPVQPTPSQPTPVQPKPTPTQPAPTQPTPVQPKPAPTPVQPTPVKPTPVKPG